MADYLPACLDSILEQRFRHVEIIVIDEYAAREPRVVAIPRNQWRAWCRTQFGTKRARGEYVMYVDSDDLLGTEALHCIIDRIESAGRPDVVIFRFARCYTLNANGNVYRQHDGGRSILSSSGSQHLDLFEWLDAHSDLEQWRHPLVARLTRHVPTVLETDDRFPLDLRRHFFHEATGSFRRHRPPGYRPAGMAGVKVRLIVRDDYRTLRLAQLADRCVRRLKSLGRC